MDQQLSNKSAKGVLWAFIESFGLRVFSVSSYFILAGLLEPKAFGLIALANTFVQFTNIFVERGFAIALVQRKEVTEKHLNSTFWGVLVIGFCLFILAFLSADLIAGLYRNEELAPVIQALSLVFVLNSLGSVHLVMLQRSFNFKSIAIANLIGIVVSGIAGVTLAFMHFGIWSLVVQQISYVVLLNLIYFLKSGWMPQLSFSMEHFKEIFQFGYKMMFNNIIFFLNRYADDILIGYFLGTQALGYYSFAYKIYNMFIDLILLPISKVLLPLFSSLQHDVKQFRSTFLSINNISCYISLAAFASMGLIVPDLILFVSGSKWAMSTTLIQVFALAGLFQFMYGIMEQSLISLGKLKQNILLNISICIVNLICIYALVHVSLQAVAFTYVVRAALLLPLLLYFISKYIGIGQWQFLRNIAKPYLTVALCLASLFLIQYLLADYFFLSIVVKGVAILSLTSLGIYLFEPDLFRFALAFVKKRKAAVAEPALATEEQEV